MKIENKDNNLKEDIKAKALKPFWNSSCQILSNNLWYPTKIDWKETDSILINKSSDKIKPNYWFSIKHFKNSNNNNNNNLSLESLFSINTENYLNLNKIKISKQIRIYPDTNQRHILRKWFGCARFCYNKTVEYLKQPGTKASWKNIKTDIIHSLPNWTKNVPYQIKSIAIRDACKAVSNAKKKFKQTGKFNEVKFRSKKWNRQNCFITKTAISDIGVYHTKFGNLKISESLPDEICDSRLIFDKDRYYLKIPTSVKTQRFDNQDICALDPGMRSFLTGYTINQIFDVGTSAYSKILRLCYAIDMLVSKRTKKGNIAARKRIQLKKAENRLRYKIDDLKKEMIHQVSSLLTKSFKYIIVPQYDFHQMANNQFSKVVRGLANLSHGMFRSILKHHAKKNGSTIIECTEEYTSKTCGCCGNIQEIGKSKKWKCKKCGTKHLRDVNGARNIFIKEVISRVARYRLLDIKYQDAKVLSMETLGFGR